MDSSLLKDFVKERFAAEHGAVPRIAYRTFAQKECGDKVCAVLGYRRASEERLFLEAYLDRPIEEALECALGRTVARRDIVEIGNLASRNAAAMVALWAQTANDFGSDAEVAVAVLTAPLRRMFNRLGVSLVEIARAEQQRVSQDGSDWGQYYVLDPIVCAGSIADGQRRLARFAERIERRAA